MNCSGGRTLELRTSALKYSFHPLGMAFNGNTCLKMGEESQL